uniref:Uncharacterized protein n=1 Tax=Romanomermis culicivorax TaxID=13658 RepID=A0A915IJ54_ROMCU
MSDDPSPQNLNSRLEYKQNFDASSYLREFYSKYDNDPAMHVVLTLLPNVVRRLPVGGRLLDVGSGPTVHVAMCFRKTAQNIYLSDYSDDSRKELFHWLLSYRYWPAEKFDWSSITKFIAEREGESDKWDRIENETRKKIKGILPCNVLKPHVIPIKNKKFDIVTTFFCLEAACNTVQEYRTAVKNVTSLIEPGGNFVMGGLLQQSWYKTGGKCYKCLYLTEEILIDVLKQCDILIENRKDFFYYDHQGIFLCVGCKK